MTWMASYHNFTGAAAAEQQQPLLQQHQHQPLQSSQQWWHSTTTARHTATPIQTPIDPPEDILATDDRYYYDGSNINAQQQNIMHANNYDVDAIVNSLSLRPPDPPGFNSSSLGKRKYAIDEDGRDISPTMPASVTKKSKVAIQSTLSNALASSSSSSALTPTTTSSSAMQHIAHLNAKSGDAPSSSINNEDNLLEEDVENEIMSIDIDDSSSCSENNNNDREEDQSDDNSSIVSESSIRNAMYQLVFGRLSMHSGIGSAGGGGGGSSVGGVSKYDAVDSKIEDLIRRSRLEATIEGRKEKERNGGGDRCIVGMRSMKSMTSSDMDMDNDDDADSDSDVEEVEVGGERRHDSGNDHCWTPGHG
ncbi:hypothetical protein ACHAXH_000289 [Discostella pseudostelligera]